MLVLSAYQPTRLKTHSGSLAAYKDITLFLDFDQQASNSDAQILHDVCLPQNWGDGFVTDASLLGAGVTTPNSFFQTLLSTRPYASNVILGPHVCAPSISMASVLLLCLKSACWWLEDAN